MLKKSFKTNRKCNICLQHLRNIKHAHGKDIASVSPGQFEFIISLLGAYPLFRVRIQQLLFFTELHVVKQSQTVIWVSKTVYIENVEVR